MHVPERLKKVMGVQGAMKTALVAASKRAPKPINPVLASIALAVQRIYGSLDNPYTSIITFLMMTWTLHKISMFERSMGRYAGGGGGGVVPFKFASIMDILLDCVIISKFLYTGVVIQVRTHEQECFLYSKLTPSFCTLEL